MSSADPTYRSRIEAAVLRAIVDESIVEADGKRRAIVDSAAVVDALATISAGLVASSPSVATMRDRRAFGERLGRTISRRIGDFRTQIATDGAPFITVIDGGRA